MSRLKRQSFLGPSSDATLWSATVGVVGLGGGGSHAAQQLAHLGIGGFVLVDPQSIDETNTNRLVGGTLADVRNKTAKVEIAARLIQGLAPTARISTAEKGWIDAAVELRSCDIIIGAVDSLIVKEQLEAFCRRNLIPYIDIGMIVTDLGGEYLISGQVIRSMPGLACLKCLGFITPEKLKVEAELYGDAGENPQVVWSNGVLASLAVGLAVQLLTPWFRTNPLVYLTFDGNEGLVRRSVYADESTDLTCPHHPLDEVGQPRFDSSVARRVAEIPRGARNEQEIPVTSFWRSLVKALRFR